MQTGNLCSFILLSACKQPMVLFSRGLPSSVKFDMLFWKASTLSADNLLSSNIIMSLSPTDITWRHF